MKIFLLARVPAHAHDPGYTTTDGKYLLVRYIQIYIYILISIFRVVSEKSCKFSMQWNKPFFLVGKAYKK